MKGERRIDFGGNPIIKIDVEEANYLKCWTLWKGLYEHFPREIKVGELVHFYRIPEDYFIILYLFSGDGGWMEKVKYTVSAEGLETDLYLSELLAEIIEFGDFKC